MELIDKEKAIEAIRAIKEVMLTNAEVIKTIEMQDVIKIDEGYIEELERKVNESRPKGKWIEDWTCSECNSHLIDIVFKDLALDECTKYCPCCGADMRGEE